MLYTCITQYNDLGVLLGQCTRMDVTFILDVSDGVTDISRNLALDTAEAVINEWSRFISDRDDGIQLACVSSGRRSEIEFQFGTYRDSRDAVDHIVRIQNRGSDDVIFECLGDVEDIYRRESNNPNLVVLISYAGRVSDTVAALLKKEDMERQGYYFYSIFIDDNNRNGDETFMRNFASSSSAYSTYTDIVLRSDFRDLDDYLRNVVCFGE